MATSPATAANLTGTSAQSTLSEWAGPYVTDMLGKAKALSEMPYQTYQGPMTAGASNLQNKVFQGLGALSFPGNLGQSFAGMTGGNMTSQHTAGGMGPYQPGMQLPLSPYNTTTQQDIMVVQQPGSNAPASPSAPARSVAEQYMNPYLQQVLQPQLAELQRQSQVNLQPALAKLTQAGGFGGGRQAIMESEAGRNLLQEQNKTVGQAYANAFDKAMQQFNTEQTQAQDLAKLMSAAGATERDIEQQGLTADYNEFLAQRDYPQKQVQFLQSMLQGLPISTVAYQPAQASGIGKLTETVGGLGSLIESLKKFNL